MNVIWVVSNFPHSANPQAGIFYKILADALLLTGCKLTIVSPTPYTGPILPLLSVRWKQYADAPNEETYGDIKVLRPRYFTIPGETDSKFAHKRILSALLKAKLSVADIIHGFGSYPIHFAAFQYAQIMGKPYVQTFIGSDVNDYPHRGEYQKKIFVELVQQAQSVLAVSQDLVSKIHALTGILTTKLVMPISNPPQVDQSRQQIRQRFAFDAEKFTVLFAGSLKKEKGIYDLINAFAEPALADCVLLLAGPDPENVAVSSHTKKLGVLNHADLLTLMTACDALILPSHSEGIPGVIKEAGQMNLPVIATEVGGIPEVIQEDTGYLIEPHNVAAIIRSILEIRNQPDLAQKKARKLRDHINKEFSPEIVAKKLMDIYNTVKAKYKV